jgi:hypothetical protein
MGFEDDLHAIRLLLDREQIRERLMQYFVHVDLRDWEPVKAIFVPGTLVDYSALMPIADARPAEEVVDEIAAAIELYSVTVHQMGNCRISVDEDTAQSETWINAHHVYADPSKNDGRLPIAGLRYQDRWVRTDNGWLVAHRRAFTDWRSWMERRGPTYVGGVHQ